MKVQESYTAKQLDASGLVLPANGGSLGGFLCTTSGTLKLAEGILGAGTILVDTFSVVAGTFTPLPFATNTYVYATLTGAKGSFAVGYGN